MFLSIGLVGYVFIISFMAAALAKYGRYVAVGISFYGIINFFTSLLLRPSGVVPLIGMLAIEHRLWTFANIEEISERLR